MTTIRDNSRNGVVVKLTEKRWVNGIRVSPHVFNDEHKSLPHLRHCALSLGSSPPERPCGWSYLFRPQNGRFAPFLF